MLQPQSVGRLFLVAAAVFFSLTGSAGATGILAIGDFGVGGTTERNMGAAMRIFESTHPADVLVTLGDNDYTERPTVFHSNWVAAFGWRKAAGVSVAGTLGNHDVRVLGGRYEFDELNMPRGFYNRPVGDVEFFILNSNNVNATQTTWLKNALSASAAPWKIVVYHHPAWTCGGYRSNAAVVRTWVPIFERYGVDLVVSGHDHNYQRFAERNGVRYVVHGGGGQHLYPLQSCPAGYPRRVVGRAIHGFLYLWTTAARLHGLAVTPARRVIDRFVIYP
jgi:calcineurin-like phosphoesterase family protein